MRGLSGHRFADPSLYYGKAIAHVNGFPIGEYGKLRITMEMHERLRTARAAAGYPTMKEAVDALGVPYPTYAGHENGTNGFRSKTAQLYARKFKVRFEWLMNGTGPMTDDDPTLEEFLRLIPRAEKAALESALYVLRQGQKPAESPKPSAAPPNPPKAMPE